MNQRIIPIYQQSDINTALLRLPVAITGGDSVHGMISDQFGRPLRDLRISVSDRCNFRCVYCMPRQVFGRDFVFIPHENMLSFEEITRVAAIFVSMGVEKIRLTGGEPLLRRNIERLIEQLRKLKTPNGKDIDLTLTTNGSILAKKAQSLYNAGLQRLTVSLDALDDPVFRLMNDVDFSVKDVLHGIEVADQIGFSPIKVNVVVKKGMNEQQILPIARYFKNTPLIPRFIEYMDVGNSNNWQWDEIIPSGDVIRVISEEMPLEPIDPNYQGETAERWRYCDGGGEVGVIASVTQAFCRDCTRVRLSTEGKLYTCLFATTGYDIRAWVRGGMLNEEITSAIAHHWQERNDRYSELRGAMPAQSGKKVEMSYIGG